jgi:mono/diheme cytochrome c family protein
MRWSTVICMCLGWLLPAIAIADDQPAQPTAQATPVDFARDIQPILSGKCVRCHGPDKAEAGLRLDDRAIAVSELESGSHAILPSDPDQSELLRRVSAQDEPMPPEGERLTDAQVSLLRQWIAAGAQWPLHWAYRPLQKSEPPQLKSVELEARARTPIDRFIWRSLSAHGMHPSSPADKRILLRRVYFDLSGLPPTPEEVDAFLADQAPDAYEHVVDRLLSSPHFGERWARHWMDIVHYADSHGFEHDMPREAWPYRDYLIRSFNTDKPYARFIEEQIAGDVLYPESPEALEATGFLATGPWDLSAQEAGNGASIDKVIAQYLDRDDVVTTVMSTFVSTTAQCARCHNHKFDPISQTEYYNLQAVFAQIDKAQRTYDPDPAIGKRREELTAAQEKLKARIASKDPSLWNADLEPKIEEWKAKILAWHTLEPVEFSASQGSMLVKQPDGSLLSTGSRPEKDVYTLTFDLPAVLGSMTALRIDVLTDDALPHHGPGRQENGNLHLNEVIVKVTPRDNPAAARQIALQNAQSDFNQQGYPAALAIDGNLDSKWGVYPEVGKAHFAAFELKEILPTDANSKVTIELHQLHGQGHLIGRVKIAATNVPQPFSALRETVSEAISQVLAKAPATRTDAERIELAAYYLQRLLEHEMAALPKPRSLYCGTKNFVQTGSFGPAKVPREVHLLERGDINKPGPLALPGSLSCVPDLSGSFNLDASSREEDRRAALAHWLSDKRNVLTWRSIANRVWQYHFGRAIVETPSDFGRMGAAPAHPELLDWMAVSLQEQGGSLKWLHRQIVLSEVYRQSSQMNADFARLDSDNQFLWRMNSRRLDAETIRDSVLQISGMLDPTMYGPPVRQFANGNVFNLRPEADYVNFDADNPANRRRSVYRFVYRTIPDPFMEAMDCPDASQLAPRRNSSITALQALAVLNDKFMVRQSEHMAEHLAGVELPQKIVKAYRLIYSRDPTEQELQLVTAYAQKHGMGNTCRMLFNANEFLFVD